jgi:DedD protein
MLDVRVKERLTGAIILVALLVLLVPELLTGPGRSAASSQTATNADGAQERTYTIDLADGSASQTATAPPAVEAPMSESQTAQASVPADAGAAQLEDADVSLAPEEPPKVESPAKVDPPAVAASKVDAPKQDSPKPQAARSAVPTRAEPPPVESRPKSGWVVQVGSFASRDNAERLTRDLKGKGFAATFSESSGKGKRLWRVRVGPEADRAAAVALGARLRAAGHSGGSVVPYP